MEFCFPDANNITELKIDLSYTYVLVRKSIIILLIK